MEMQQYQVFFCLCLSLLLGLRTCLAIDFCNITSCEEKTHIGCNNSLTFDVDKCLRFHDLANMQNFQRYLLSVHNQYRQGAAYGLSTNLPKARKMPELIWDDYLALVAEYHLKGCRRALPNDSCVATDDFPDARFNYDENVFRRLSHRQSNVRKITELTEAWMDEVHDLENINTVEAGDNIGNILTDRSTHMGCAAGQDYDLRKAHYALVCYYSAGPLPSGTLFEAGSFNESLCAHGKSKEYPLLCKTLPLYH